MRHFTMRRVAFWLLLMFIASLPWEGAIPASSVGSIAKLLGIAALSVGLLSLFRGGRIEVRPPTLFLVAAGVFVLWGTVSVGWSSTPTVTFRAVITYVQLLGMIWLIWELTRERVQLLMLMQAYLIGCFVASGLAIHAFATTQQMRYVGGVINANDLAFYVVLGIPLAWKLVLEGKGRLILWANALYPAVATFVIVIAASRGALLAALVALTFIPLTLSNVSRTTRLFTLCVLAIGYFAVVANTSAMFPRLVANVERLAEVDEELKSGTLSNRRFIWSAGLDVFWENPVVGVGLGGFRHSIVSLYGKSAASHNSFLSVLVDLGLVGLTLFCLLLLSAVGLAPNSSFRDKAFVLVAFLTLVVGMTPLEVEDRKPVWFILALLASQRQIVLVSTSHKVVFDSRMISIQKPDLPM